MHRYTICCTAEQTRKALELGAPIEIYDTFDSYDIKESNIFYKDKFIELADGRLIESITCEQMIGWLEEQGFEIDITKGIASYVFNLYFDQEYIDGFNGYNIRKEATLAAIDAALEYLKATFNNSLHHDKNL